MSELKFPVEEIDDGTGRVRHMHQASCACSNVDPENEEQYKCDVFYAFWDTAFNPPHLHLQCYDCEQTYCPYGQCVPPSTVKVIS